ESLDAWELLMRAMVHYQRMTKADSRAGIELLKQAIQRFPDYAQAHSLLAMLCLVSGHMSWVSATEVRQLAEDCARRAALLDNSDPWAHVALGYLASVARNTEAAVGEYRIALQLNPNFAAASGYLGMALAFAGQADEAIPHLERAIRLSPRDAQAGIF